MQIASHATPEGLAGHMWPEDHSLSTTELWWNSYRLWYNPSFYACESWSLSAKLQRSIQTLKLRWLRRVLGIRYNAPRTITKHVRHYKTYYHSKEKTVRWYRNVTRSSRLSKIFLQETV